MFSPLTALKKGTARIWFHKRLLLWLYLINVLFSAVLVYPFREVVSKISKTDLADLFLSGFRLDAFMDYSAKYSATLNSLGQAAIGLGILYFIVTIFLTGGIVASLAVQEKVTLRRLVGTSGEYFWRYMRLFLAFGVTIGLLLTAHHFLLAEWLETLQENTTTGRAASLLKALEIIVMLGVLSIVLMVFDYAKIQTVVDNRRSMFFVTFAAIGFSFRRIFQTTWLFCLNVLIVGFLFAVYLIVENQFSGAMLASTLGLLFVQQILVLCRIWMRVSFFASQMEFYESARPTAPEAAPELPESTPEPAPLQPFGEPTVDASS